MLHPKVAYRSCDHCREWFYNEEDGEVITGRDGEPVKRPGAVPCDSSLGCAKGHYSNPKVRRLSAAEEMLITLFHASRASGGRVLNKHERNDDVLVILFSHLERIYQARNTSELASAMAATLAHTRGR